MSLRFAAFYAAGHINNAIDAGCTRNLLQDWAIDVARKCGVSVRRAKWMIQGYL